MVPRPVVASDRARCAALLVARGLPSRRTSRQVGEPEWRSAASAVLVKSTTEQYHALHGAKLSRPPDVVEAPVAGPALVKLAGSPPYALAAAGSSRRCLYARSRATGSTLLDGDPAGSRAGANWPRNGPEWPRNGPENGYFRVFSSRPKSPICRAFANGDYPGSGIIIRVSGVRVPPPAFQPRAASAVLGFASRSATPTKHASRPRRAGWPAERRDRVKEIIVRHMWPEVDPALDAEGHLLREGTALDISGHNVDTWPADFRAEVLAALPATDARHRVHGGLRGPGSPQARLRSGCRRRVGRWCPTGR